jgi:hypothetical protein
MFEGKGWPIFVNRMAWFLMKFDITAVQDAHGAERQLMAQGDATSEPPKWRPVFDLGVKVLAEKSKELDARTHETIARFSGHKNTVFKATFSPDSRRLAS